MTLVRKSFVDALVAAKRFDEDNVPQVRGDTKWTLLHPVWESSRARQLSGRLAGCDLARPGESFRMSTGVQVLANTGGEQTATEGPDGRSL